MKIPTNCFLYIFKSKYDMVKAMDAFFYCCCDPGDAMARQQSEQMIEQQKAELRNLQVQQIHAQNSGDVALAELYGQQILDMEQNIASREETSVALMCTVFLCVFVCTGSICATFYWVLTQ